MGTLILMFKPSRPLLVLIVIFIGAALACDLSFLPGSTNSQQATVEALAM